jgi:endonuclease III related protein
MLRHWGPQNWWPAQSRFEVIVGAYLTQNTNWKNVEKALVNLRRARAVSARAIREMPLERLQELIRPSGYYRQKAIKLKVFMEYLDEKYAGSLDRMFGQPTAKLREELLALNGVGPETADSILLYAGNHPVFVVDAYTRRILERHGLITPATKYEEIRAMMEFAVTSAKPDDLAMAASGTDPRSSARNTVEPRHPPSRMSRMSRTELAQHYNELHALIVRVGNQLCRSLPRCESCPLQPFLTLPAKQQTSTVKNRSK